MQAADYVKFADLVAAGIASQSAEMRKAIEDYKKAVAEWDKRNDLSSERSALEAAKVEFANAQVLASREQDVFKTKVADFNAKVDKAAAEDKARKEMLAQQLKTVEAAVAACEKQDAASKAAAATRTAELDKRAAELEQLQQSLNTREKELILRENKLKAAQVQLGKALA